MQKSFLLLQTVPSASTRPNVQPFTFTPRRSSKSRAVLVSASSSPGVGREVLTPSQRTKLNKEDDRAWYSIPRLVQHSDGNFRSQVTELYRQKIPSGAVVLDLCSSWVSHLPPEVEYSKVVGHGLNAAELAQNERLDQFFVRNLNEEPTGWALADNSVDTVLICCSVQYLQQPELVFSEICRVLKPGGVCIVTFTNRLFYEKAVSVWRDASMYARSQLVKQYFMAVDGFEEPEALTSVAGASSAARSLFETAFAAFEKFLAGGYSDPFHAVVCYKSPLLSA